MRLETAIEDFLYFLKEPIFEYKRDQPLDFLTVTKLYFLVFFFEMLVFIPVSAIIGLEGIPHAMEGLLKSNSMWKMFLLAVVLAPISEEFLFRLHLRYKSLTIIFVSLVALVLVGMVYNYFVPESFGGLRSLSRLTIMLVTPIGFVVLLLFFLTLGIALYKFFKNKNFKIVEREFPFIFYLTALVFGLVHISNFGLEPDKWFMAPLLVLPQLILACYLGYVRVRNNLGYSIYIHALNNAIPMLLFSLGVSN